MGLLSLFKSSDKVADMGKTIVEGTVAGIDKIFYTEEEKAENKMKITELKQKGYELWLKLQETIANENTARSITRRILAVMFCGSYLLLLLASATLFPWFAEWAGQLFEYAKVLTNPVLAVIIFYFGPYAVGKYLSKKE